jgi:hypothetical protein
MSSGDRSVLLAVARKTIAKVPFCFATTGDVLEIARGTGLVTRRLRKRIDPGSRRQLLHEAGFREERIERKRIQVDGVGARPIALGQIRGTPRSVLLEKRGVSLDDVVEKVAAALARAGGADPWRGPANAVVVEARAGTSEETP